jgi:hypothetical protein
MRINKLQLAGLAAALVGAAAGNANAGDVTISTATTTPLATSNPDGSAVAGDVTVASGGSITVTTGETAVTVDSSNDVTVASGGSLMSSDADDTTGILLLGGNSGLITNAGTIALTETYVHEDADDDGDLDGEFAIGENRHGILLQAGPTFTGDIVNSGVITIEGANSSGIRLDALLTGDLISTGGLNITGDDSAGIIINGGAAGGVTGDVIVRGVVNVRGENSSGLVVNGAIGGELRINGNWTTTGFHSLSPPVDTSGLEAEDTRSGGSPVAVHFSVGGGITIEGVGVEDDEDDDGDGVTEADGDTDDDVTAVITSYGPAPAVLIQADPSANLVLGATASGYGLHVRGSLTASGLYEGVDATALRVEGDGGGATVTTANGIAIDNVLGASAREADAYGVYIGVDATVPTLIVRRQVSTTVVSDGANASRALFFAAGANVPTVDNSGTLRSTFLGETGNAIVIEDQSNTLTTINNSGTIQALIAATDDDPSDGVPPPPITGAAVAIDVSASTVDVTFNQIPDTPFTDDDAVDNDAAGRPAIRTHGEIRFGSGNDAVNLLAGEIVGDIAFGLGSDAFVIDNGASYLGRLSDSDGDLSIDVLDGRLGLGGGTLDITTAYFAADAELGIFLSETIGQSTFINASGTVTFDPGAVVAPIVPTGLPNSGTHTFLTAANLVGGANVTGVVSGGATPWIYNLAIAINGVDPNSLDVSYVMKTAVELGLTTNQTAAFASIINALRLDDDASAALSSLTTDVDFFDAYEDLMPSYASGATELAATAIQQMQSATSNRLAATRLHELNEVSVWAQEIGYGLDREPPTANGQAFSGQGFGFAVGIDGPLENGALFGLSASFIASEVEEDGRPEGEISAWFGQANAYLGTAMGPVDLDFILGAGAGKLQSRRFVEIGDSFSALAEADWWAYEGHGAVRASVPLSLTDWFVVTPQAALTYVALGESGYTESGGGVAIDYDVDDAFSQRLWADAGVEFSVRWRLRSGGIIAPRLYAGYRANAIDEEAERTVRFASGGSEFTLTDEGLGDGGPLLGIGIDATNGYSTFSLAYEGEFGDQIERHSLNAAIRFRF